MGKTIRVILDLTPEQAEKLVEATVDYCDKGPTHAGWKSEAWETAGEAIRPAVQAAEAPPEKHKPLVLVRAEDHHSFRLAVASVPDAVREYLRFEFLHNPAQLRGRKQPLVWRAIGWDRHPVARELDLMEAERECCRWSWPPQDQSS